MTDVVANTVKQWRQTRFEWGLSDCFLSLADYLVETGLPDFGAIYRGKYNDEAGARECINKHGSEIGLLNTTGLKIVAEPVRGDLVLVRIGLYIAGLYTGQSVVFRTERGVVEVDDRFLNIVQAWRVPKCHQ